MTLSDIPKSGKIILPCALGPGLYFTLSSTANYVEIFSMHQVHSKEQNHCLFPCGLYIIL